jgi:SPP1 family predicted phage head-tail adaptor
MLAGDLKERIVVQALASAPISGTGGMSETFRTLFSAWANVKAERPGRFVDGEQVDDVSTHSFLIRYRAGWRDAKFVEWSGRRWRVTACAEVEPRQWVAIKAVEEGAA